MTAVRKDVVVEQGATFELAVTVLTTDDGVTYSPKNLTGYTGSMQIRSSVDATAVLATATVTIDSASGVVTATISDTLTNAMTWRAGVYDLEIANGSRTDRLAYGNAKLERQVTR